MRNPKLAAEIAKQLRRFHQVEIPGSKEPQLWNDVSKFFEKGLLLIYAQSAVAYNLVQTPNFNVNVPFSSAKTTALHQLIVILCLNSVLFSQHLPLNLMRLRSRVCMRQFRLKKFRKKLLSSRYSLCSLGLLILYLPCCWRCKDERNLASLSVAKLVSA